MAEDHLPYFGVGPYLVGAMAAIGIAALALECFGLMPFGESDEHAVAFGFAGTLLLLCGACMFYLAFFSSKIDDSIEGNVLVTDGIYAYVRNPIYTAFMLMFTGVLLYVTNWVFLLIPFAYWAMIYFTMRATEERWLLERYGSEYEEYCARTNRVIPFFPRKTIEG